MEAAQRLAEKSKAALQSVRQELTAECSAAKAQVEVERKLALEAEDRGIGPLCMKQKGKPMHMCIVTRYSEHSDYSKSYGAWPMM